MINRLIVKYPFLNPIWTVLVIIFASVCFAVALNIFLLPGNIYSGGLTGAAQLLTYFFDHVVTLPFSVQTGTLYFLINVPMIILAWFQLGQRFTLLTLIVVATSSLMSNLIPITQVSSDPFLNGIIGGVVSGSGIGVLIKYGMSSGGTDILAMVMNRKTGHNVGSISFMMNLIIIAFAGYLYSPENALFTLVSMFVASYTINVIHTNEQRLTVLIVSSKEDEVINSIYSRINRGLTILDGRGGYSKRPRHVLMVVINRYELFEMELAIEEVDPDAFVNIIQSTKVSGYFLSREQQEKLKKQSINYN